MFWSCPNLETFWTEVFDSISRAYGLVIDPNPLSAIFGVPPDNGQPVVMKRALAFTTLLARRLILFKWKHTSPPTHNRWIKEVLYNIKLEKLRFSIKGSAETFERTWNPLLLYLEALSITPDAEEE